jgi:hypothetical protein
MTQGETQVIGLVGSYRIGGTIDTAVGEVLAAAASAGATTRKIRLAEQSIEFCTNCRGCMQEPGTERGACIFRDDDDMESILQALERADAIVLGAPVNLGDINALTRRFMERSVGYLYWPWGTQGGPKLRNPKNARRAVLLSSSAAPGFMNNRLFGLRAMRSLKLLAGMLGADVVGKMKVGFVTEQDFQLSARDQRRARELGAVLLR